MNVFRILFPQEPLCYTCANAFIVRGFRERDERIFCEFFAPERLVPFAVRDCAGYSERNTGNETSAPGNAGARKVVGFVRKAGIVAPSPEGKEDEPK